MIVAIIQARTGSTRLPRKVLKKVCGKTLLEHQILRVKRSETLDKIVIATTEKKKDDPIVSIAKKTGVSYFRGSEDDVLDRYYQAAKKNGADYVVRLTGDCPLSDPEIIDRVVRYYLKNKEKYDYVSNVRPPTFPDGMDIEIFTFAALEKSWQKAKLPSEREHVSAYIAKNRRIFRIGNFENSFDSSHFRLTVDEPEDLKLIREIFRHLYPKKQNFHLNDILNMLNKNSKLIKLNAGIIRDEGYLKSLKKDKLLAKKQIK